MEIKITEEFWNEATDLDAVEDRTLYINKKKWVAVDDILKRLRDYQAGCSPTVVMDIIEELSH